MPDDLPAQAQQRFFRVISAVINSRACWSSSVQRRRRWPWHGSSIRSRIALSFLATRVLVLFLPGLFFLLPRGHVADRFDRRHVILVCYALQAFCTTAPLPSLPVMDCTRSGRFFSVLFLIGTGRAFSGPASSALIPHLVPKEHFVNAVTWGATAFQIANVAGPSLGGVLYTLPLHGRPRRSGHCLPLYAGATLIAFLWLIFSLHVRPGRMEHRAVSTDVILAGIRYVWNTQILLGSISLDLFVVLLGGAVALMPIFAQEILHTGPRGLGLLRRRAGHRRTGDFHVADLAADSAPALG